MFKDVAYCVRGMALYTAIQNGCNHPSAKLATHRVLSQSTVCSTALQCDSLGSTTAWPENSTTQSQFVISLSLFIYFCFRDNLALSLPHELHCRLHRATAVYGMLLWDSLSKSGQVATVTVGTYTTSATGGTGVNTPSELIGVDWGSTSGLE